MKIVKFIGGNPQPCNLDEYAEWGANNDHVVQVSFPRSGRVWISGMVIFSHCKDINLRMSLDSKSYEPDLLSSVLYYTTHLYNEFPVFDHAKYVLLVRDPRSAILSLRRWTEKYISPGYFNRKVLERWIDEWRCYIETFMDMNTLVVQYERMCLYPALEIERIMRFAGLEINNAMEFLYNGNVLTKGSGIDRYTNFCLKWDFDDNMRGCCNKIVVDKVGDLMMGFGYTKEGHARNMFVER